MNLIKQGPFQCWADGTGQYAIENMFREVVARCEEISEARMIVATLNAAYWTKTVMMEADK